MLLFLSPPLLLTRKFGYRNQCYALPMCYFVSLHRQLNYLGAPCIACQCWGLHQMRRQTLFWPTSISINQHESDSLPLFFVLSCVWLFRCSFFALAHTHALFLSLTFSLIFATPSLPLFIVRSLFSLFLPYHIWATYVQPVPIRIWVDIAPKSEKSRKKWQNIFLHPCFV